MSAACMLRVVRDMPCAGEQEDCYVSCDGKTS